MTEVLTRKNKKTIKIKFRHRHPILFHLMIIMIVTTVSIGSLGAMYLHNVLSHTPTITEYELKSDGTSNMYDVNNTIIWSSSGIKRDYITFDKIPSTYVDLLLSVEDDSYYENEGFSWTGLGNAIYTTVASKFNKSIKQRGGSGINQQLIKQTAFLNEDGTADVTIDRKIKELWLAYQLDKNFDKSKILEFYINKIFMGENSYGADTIAMTYFGVHLSDLQDRTPENLSKLALIAGLGQSPSSYNLYDNPDLVKKRRDIVLLSAYNNKKISKKEFQDAKKVDVTLGLKERFWRNNEVQERIAKYNAYISGALNQVNALGYDLDKTPLQIYTHLNPEKQEWLTNEVNNGDNGYQNEDQQIAVTVTDVNTGVVIAQSGGRREEANGLNRATQNTRSSGSTIKPFIGYGPAIEYLGYSTNYLLDSGPYTYPGTNIVATNYLGYSYGNVTMSKALALSLNTPVNRLLDEHLGSAYVKEFLNKVGLDVKDGYGGSDALGLNVSTEQFASAFATLANGGIYRAPNYLSKLVFSDSSEKPIEATSNRAMKTSTAFMLTKMLERTTQPNQSATKAAIPEFAGHLVKTGTVGYDYSTGVWHPDLSASDSWTSGATKSIAVSVWTGYDTPNVTGNEIGQHNTTSAQVYVKVMRYFNGGLDTSAWSKPDTVIDLGNDEYKSNEGVLQDIAYPKVPVDLDISNILNVVNTDVKTIDVEPLNKESGVPTDYTLEGWLNALSEEDKKVYDYWKSNNKQLPKISDYIDNKTSNVTSSN